MAAQTNWKLEPTARWIRVKLGGVTIADSKHVLLMLESRYQLTYYFPKQDVLMDLLTESGKVDASGYKGDANFYTVTAGGHTAEHGAWTYSTTLANRPDLSEHVAFQWDAMDAWYEEDEQVFVHPRDPYHRVDTIASTRHIRVVIDGETVAETSRPHLLFETGLPTRYYMPQEDVRMDLLTPTETHTSCPYKGEASYWTVNIGGNPHQDVIWGYPDPISEIPRIKGLVSFYNEKLDIYIDGVLEAKPRTIWS